MCTQTMIEREGKAFVVHLDINLQMWTGLYVEPDIDKPETYEHENKRFVLTKFELNKAVGLAVKQAKEMRSTISRVELLQRAGFTYSEVHRIVTGEVQVLPTSIIVPSDNKYKADEDLACAHAGLGELWWFISMARDAMAS